MRTFSLVAAALLSAVGTVAADPVTPVTPPAEPTPILTNRPDAATPTAQQSAEEDSLLGPAFESRSAGIAFRPPSGMKEIRRTIAGDEIVRYVDDKRKWVVVVSRLTFSQATKLTAQNGDPAGTRGLLEMTAEQDKIDMPGAEILRQDAVTVGGAAVGEIAARYSMADVTNLTQQAIFCANDRLFYVMNFTTPVPRDVNASDDPTVKKSVDVFQAMLDTVKLMDLSSVRAEQDDRLIRTRYLYVNLTEARLKAALVKEQWWRLLKDGKDIGYSYVVEETGRDLPRTGHKESEFTGANDGILIGIRSRTMPEAGLKVDAETWMWMSYDRRSEKWSNIAVRDSGQNGRDLVGDAGAADTEERTVADPNLLPGEKFGPKPTDQDPRQPAFVRAEQYILHVENIGKNQNAEPIVRSLPPYYLPQALGHLLPRLVPRDTPVTYLFASYVGDTHQVMMRYVDVGAPVQVTLGDKTMTAIPVADRIGMEGSVTTHYVSLNGEYLGSVNPDSKVTVLPSDANTLMKIWKDADLSRPGAVGPRQ